MTVTKVVQFGDYKVEMKLLKLRDANLLFPFVGSAMTKIGFGNLDFFSDLRQDQLDMLQQKICEYSVKIVREENDKGDIIEVRRSFSLSDLDDNVRGVMALQLEFLEWNFGFFSDAPGLLRKMFPKLSESEEQKIAA